MSLLVILTDSDRKTGHPLMLSCVSIISLHPGLLIRGMCPRFVPLRHLTSNDGNTVFLKMDRSLSKASMITQGRRSMRTITLQHLCIDSSAFRPGRLLSRLTEHERQRADWVLHLSLPQDNARPYRNKKYHCPGNG